MLTKARQESVARVTAASAGVVVVACIVLLVLDYVNLRRSAPLDDSRELALEEKVREDADVALELTAERERQTAISLARDSVNETIGIVLLIASAAFLIGAKWLLALGGRAALPVEKIVAAHTTAAKAAARRRSGSGAEAVSHPEIDLGFVDAVIKQEGGEPEAAIPILRAIQSHYGYLPDEAMNRLCERTAITLAQIAGTSSFYAQFRRSAPGKHLVRICRGTACHVTGIVQVAEEIRRYLDVAEDGDTDARRLFTLEDVACLGCCSLAPVMMIDGQTVGKLTPSGACEALHDAEPE